MADLSPQAQAVLDAMYEVNMDFGGENATLAAAALEAAADQVVSEPAMILKGGRTYEAWTATVHSDIRSRLLAIVAELRGQGQQHTED
jgi:hypothetical protein